MSAAQHEERPLTTPLMGKRKTSPDPNLGIFSGTCSWRGETLEIDSNIKQSQLEPKLKAVQA